MSGGVPAARVGVQLGDAGPVHYNCIDVDFVLRRIEGIGQGLNDAAFAVGLGQIGGFAKFVGAFAEEAHKIYLNGVLRGDRQGDQRKKHG